MAETEKITITVDSVELTGDLTPSAVTPGEEIIRNSERALDGHMRTDIVAVKENMEIVWPLLSRQAFGELQKKFPKYCNVKVKSFTSSNVNKLLEPDSAPAARSAEPEAVREIDCYVDSISYKPFVLGAELWWQEVTVKLVEV